MAEIDYTSLGKFISLILRHKPQTINITLDENGWADVDFLLKGINNSGKYIDKKILETIVETNNKKRYSFNEDHSKIRANQGHSINVDVELKEVVPPDKLYHGTADRFLESIMAEGLKKMSRQYVHLSKDIPTAINVGKRHGKPVVLEIDAKRMIVDRFKFYLSENNVWLSKEVPSRYLRIL